MCSSCSTRASRPVPSTVMCSTTPAIAAPGANVASVRTLLPSTVGVDHDAPASNARRGEVLIDSRTASRPSPGPNNPSTTTSRASASPSASRCGPLGSPSAVTYVVTDVTGSGTSALAPQGAGGGTGPEPVEDDTDEPVEGRLVARRDGGLGEGGEQQLDVLRGD